MYHKESSRSFCTLDHQEHFCISVGGVGRELPNSNVAQLFSIFHAVPGARPAFNLMDTGDHGSALDVPSPIFCSEIRCFIPTALEWFDVVTFVHMNNFVLSKELTQERATSFNSKVRQAQSDCSPPRTSEGKPG
jgi:hypothetical protein